MNSAIKSVFMQQLIIYIYMYTFFQNQNALLIYLKLHANDLELLPFFTGKSKNILKVS